MRKLALAALFLLPVLFLLPWLGSFPYQPAATFSDLAVSHLPNALFLKRSLLEWGQIPLWSTTILSGYPFFANPLSGLYYLPGWLALLFPLPLGLNLLVVLHLIFAGLGMFLFLRSLGLSEWAALFGALTFEALPKLYGHYGAGHITLIYAIAWTPWLLLAEQKRSASSRMRWVLPGALLGLLTLADVRWLAYAALLWLAFSFARLLSADVRRAWPAWLAARLTNLLIALMIAAPLLLPLAQYTRLSTRAQLAPAESFTLSLPPGQLLGLIYPVIGGSAEWVLYPGAVSFALLLFAVSERSVRRRCAFWLLMILATLVYALGSYIPPLELLANLPGLNLLRVPPRMLFLTGLCMAVCASYALDALVAAAAGRQPVEGKRPALVLFAVTAFAVLFALAVWAVVTVPLTRIQFGWGALVMLLGAAAILLGLRQRIPARGLALALLVTALVDLIAVNRLSLTFRAPEQVFAQGDTAAEYIALIAAGETFRVYSPSYSIPQHTAAVYNLELADGVDPLQLSSYAHYMENATGVPSSGYSVTLPAFATGRPALDNQNAVPDAALLGLLNVRYVVADFPLAVDGLTPLAEFGRTSVYQNDRAVPRAWVQSTLAGPTEGTLTTLTLDRSPNTISIDAVSGPGVIMLSEIVYPGWQARIDGRLAEIEPVGDLLRSIVLPQGVHSVELTFRPAPLYIGLGLAGLAGLVLLVLSRVPGREPASNGQGGA